MDAEGLERAAVLLATRAFRPFSVMGEAVAGADSVANAPVITAGTQYMDEFDGNSDGTYYLLERQIERSTIAVGVSGRAPSRMTDAMYARLYPESRPDRACSQDHESFGGGAAHHLLALGAGVFSVDADDPCMTDDRLILEITGFRKTDQRMPYEIRIQEDPFPENASELLKLDRPDSGWTIAGAEGGADGVVEGGSSLNDRTAIEPGAYTVDILPGEAQYFRVPVDWGQNLRVRAITEPIDPDRYAVGGVTLRVLDPLGADITNVNVRDDEGNNPFDLFTRGSAVRVAAAPAAPALAARGDFSRMGSGSTLAGEHTLVFAVSAMEGVPLIPYTLTVEVEGEPTGVPEFGEATPTESDEPKVEATEESDEGISLVAMGVIAAGVVVVAALVTGLVFWLRSRAK